MVILEYLIKDNQIFQLKNIKEKEEYGELLKEEIYI